MNHKDICNVLSNWSKEYPRSTFYIEESIHDYYTNEKCNAYTFQIKCIHGQPFAIDVKYKNQFRSYDTQWNELPLFVNKQLADSVQKPPVLNKMLEYAKKCQSLLSSFELIFS